MDETGSPACSDLVHGRGDEAALGPEPGEKRQIAALAAAEGEVGADVQLRRPETAGEQRAREVLRLRQREVARERDDEKRLDPDRLDRLLLLAQGLDAPGSPVGPEHGHRVGLEGDRERGPVDLAGAGHDRLQNLSVAEMNTVEVADRSDASSREVRLAQGIADDLHGEKLSAAQLSAFS